jgi:GNAT superfamily N-acetyltransferase
VTEARAADSPTIRRAAPADAVAVAEVYLASFHATYTFPLAHTDDQVRGWIAEHLVPGLETWVALLDDRIVAVLALDDAGIDQLYVHPDAQGRGIGSELVELAKQRRPGGLELYTFQVNARARRFYERQGFVVAAMGDGSGNEEGQPDVLYRWRPASRS